MSNRPVKIGLLGGVASGKSAVSAALRDRGAVVIDADAAAREVLERPKTAARLKEAFGPGILDASGRVDRANLAKAAFSAPEALAKMNGIMLPEILGLMEERERAAAGAAVLVFDAPLLFETGLAGRCDVLVFVDAPDEVRASRAAARGMDGEEWKRREAAQRSLDEKRRVCGVILDNSGPIERAIKQASDLYDRLCAASGGGMEGGSRP